MQIGTNTPQSSSSSNLLSYQMLATEATAGVLVQYVAAFTTREASLVDEASSREASLEARPETPREARIARRCEMRGQKAAGVAQPVGVNLADFKAAQITDKHRESENPLQRQTFNKLALPVSSFRSRRSGRPGHRRRRC